MHREYSEKEEASKLRDPDIQEKGSVLLISQRARDVFAPFMPDNTEILPVEVENSDDVFWVRPICIEGALDVERSYSSGGCVFERPALIGEKIHGEHFFCYREVGNKPVFSEKLVKAIEDNDLYGVIWRYS